MVPALQNRLRMLLEEFKRWRAAHVLTMTLLAIAAGFIVGEFLAAVYEKGTRVEPEAVYRGEVSRGLRMAGVPRREIEGVTVDGAERGIKLLVLGYSLLCMNDPREATVHRINCNTIFALRSIVIPDERIVAVPGSARKEFMYCRPSAK